jgi:hypothetical protein
MTQEPLYHRCLPILQDIALDDDDRAEKLELFVRDQEQLSGKDLEDAVLQILWRFRSNTHPNSANRPPQRITVIKKTAPAAWQVARVPTPSSSLPKSLGAGLSPSPNFLRTSKSNAASPFTSPRNSPRLSFATTYIPHSPRLDAYLPAPSEPSPKQEYYENLSNDSFEWLTGDDAISNASSLPSDSLPNEAANALIMGPHDMLRSIFGEEFSNEYLEKTLEANGYDIAVTMNGLIESRGFIMDPAMSPPPPTILIGKSLSPKARPSTPAKTTVVCRYFLSNGSCARADCKFSHDTSATVCKYWLAGNCLAGDTCVFAHDPSLAYAKLAQTPPRQIVQPNLQDYDAFPTLHGAGGPYMADFSSPTDPNFSAPRRAASATVFNPLANFTPSSASRPQSRPGSRPGSRAATPSFPPVGDNDAFPSLDSASKNKAHRGRRGGGHGHAHKPSPSSLVDVVRMAGPGSPSPSQNRNKPSRSRLAAAREFNVAAMSIPAPEYLPWVATGDVVNKAYVKARAEAFKHASQRNKLLQG